MSFRIEVEVSQVKKRVHVEQLEGARSEAGETARRPARAAAQEVGEVSDGAEEARKGQDPSTEYFVSKTVAMCCRV